jgi:hypothetical protein
MQLSSRSKVSIVFLQVAVSAVLGIFMVAGALRWDVLHARAAPTASSHAHISCADGRLLCTEVQNPEEVFGEDQYVGHDEPSLLFYSNQPGSGNQMTWQLTLPKDPPTLPTQGGGGTFNFQLHPAFWFGMAMCDTQSYPEQVSTCTPDSDSNIVDPAVSPNHPGTAFMELQFYPPGYVQQFTGFSCDATRWCAALTIDSLSQDPVNGTTLNSTCTSSILGGTEYVNFAYLTKNGIPQAVPNPVQFNPADQTPDPNKVVFMNSGDRLIVTLHDSGHGLVTRVNDLTTHQKGLMTASAANGFGQVKYAPTGTDCTNIPYDFHPMYSTSSEQTRVIWAAHSYNIAFSDEIGHFDFCNGPNAITPGGSCPAGNTEGVSNDTEPTDGDDNACFPGSASTRVQVSACLDTNTGFDGVPYKPVWPDGNTTLHPTPIQFSSPLTVGDLNYDRVAFEADLPRIEFNTCNRSTGAGCTLIPTTDDGTPANFYPFYSTGTVRGQCTWMLGNDIPGVTANDFGKNNQYGTLLPLTYLAVGGHGATIQRFNDFRQILSSNPCNLS